MNRRVAAVLMYAAGVLVTGATTLRAQDWTTAGYDAQRSSWVRSDAKISPDNLRKPGFQLLWKVDVGSGSTPVLLDLLIGDRGFRSLGFVGSKADHVLAIDTDLGRTEWERGFPSPPRAGSPACAAGFTPGLTRATNAAVPAAAYGGRRSGQGAQSAVGEPGQGAVTLPAARRPGDVVIPFKAPPRPPPQQPSRPRPNLHPFPLVYALASDGTLHTLNVMDGSDADPPVPFLPPYSDARGLIVVDDVAYVATNAGCGKAPAGVWALDLGSKQVTTRTTAGIAGAVGPAIGPDGTIYVATTSGELQAFEPRTLAPKGAYRAAGPGFTSSPVIFEQGGSMLIAAASRDGRIHLVSAARLAAVTAPAGPTAGPGGAAGATVSWSDSSGTRWLLAAAGGGVVAWRVIDEGGVPTLQPGWTSREIVSPLTPMVINGVVFAVSSGPGPSGASVLYALDGATGRELWSSGTAIAGVARGGLAGESGQVYVGTSDGTLYAFGFPMEH